MKAIAASIEFPEATGDWEIVTHFYVADGANQIGHGELLSGKEILTGEVARFRAGELVITLN